MVKKVSTTRILLVVCAVLLAGNIGWVVRDTAGNANGGSATLALQRQYPLLSKRVLADNLNDILMNFVPLRKALTQRFATLNVQKSFYFEYLPDGTTIRVGGDQELIAASLIKVPLTMNLYRAAELGRINLDQTVTVTAAELDDSYGNLWKQGAGTHLTLRRAAQLALEQSDNTAAHVIFDHTQSLLSDDEQSLARLDVDQTMQNGQAVITAKSYTSVLKSLYFASYITKDDSQELLGYLTKSTAGNRLAKYISPGVSVAHKVGVYNTSWSESDCGIVYVPKRPYAICVMVGLPEQAADQFIADISKQVYDYVVAQ